MLTKHPGDSREPGLSETVKHFPQKDGSSQEVNIFFPTRADILFVVISVNYENALVILK